MLSYNHIIMLSKIYSQNILYEYEIFIENTKKIMKDHENKIKILERQLEYIIQHLKIQYINDNYILL